jgi:eukaryotic translation initiation factor 2C
MNRQVVGACMLVPPKIRHDADVANPGTSGRWDLKSKKLLWLKARPLERWSVAVIVSEGFGEVVESQSKWMSKAGSGSRVVA